MHSFLIYHINSQKGGVDEEVLGHLRSAAGKARLLATKKFKQFEGMIKFHSMLRYNNFPIFRNHLNIENETDF